VKFFINIISEITFRLEIFNDRNRTLLLSKKKENIFNNAVNSKPYFCRVKISLKIYEKKEIYIIKQQ
jgi:hypothetical protein